MNKNEILEKLNSLKLDRDKFIIISGASLAVQNIIESTGDIDLVCDKEYYKTINWPTKIGALGAEIKYFDVFEISPNLYEEGAKMVEINGFKFLNLKDVLKVKKLLNRPKDQQVITKLEQILKEEKWFTKLQITKMAMI